MATMSAAPPSASLALATLFYAAPIAAGTAFLITKSVAACLLHQSSEHASARRRRYPLVALQTLSLATAVVEWLSILAETRRFPDQWPSKHFFSYLVLETFLQTCLVCGLFEAIRPIYYPYQTAWLVEILLSVPILALQAKVNNVRNGYAGFRIFVESARVAILLLLCVATACFALFDRRRVIKLDVESEALLAANRNGHLQNGAANGPKTGLISSAHGERDGGEGRETSTDSDTDEDGDDYVERERNKTRNEQAKRMQEAGSVWGYAKSFKVFVPLVVPMKNRLAQICLATIFAIVLVERALNILIPMQLGHIIDELTSNVGTGVVPWRTIALWVLYRWLDSGTGLSLIQNEAQLVLEQFAYKEILTVSFRHIMCLSMDFHSNKNSGELIQAMSQAQSLTDILQYTLFEVSPVFFDIFLAITVLSRLFDVYMALILFVCGSVYFWLGLRMTKWSLDSRREYQAASRKESRVSSEALNNWTTVSHFNRADFEARRYGDAIDVFNRKQWWYYQTFYIGGGAQGLVMLTGRVLATFLAAHRVVHGRASVGDFFFLQSYWGQMQVPLDTLQFSIRRISGMMVDAERLLQVLTTQPSVTSAPEAPALVVKAGEVVFDHVDFAYDVRKPTLRDINFTARPGQTIALVGETGGGKSTVLKLLYRYFDVSAGAIRIDGQDVRQVGLDSLRDAFGMVPQDPALFNVSLLENLRYARLDATDEEIKAACQAACIHDKIMSFPDQYRAVVGERGMKLSGGELQRVAIARAMLRQPQLVLLDEATSQIDADTEAQIQTALRRLTAGRTTFIIAHRLATIQHADLILVIGDGEIVQRGTHEELFRQKGKYRDLWAKQLSREAAAISLVDDTATAAETLAAAAAAVADIDAIADADPGTQPQGGEGAGAAGDIAPGNGDRDVNSAKP